MANQPWLSISVARVKRVFAFFTLGSVILLQACGGGGGGDSGGGTPPPAPTPETGVFLDGPIANIGYRTETIEGVTDADGKYRYLPGEHVTFFIGALEFPPVTATGVVTPLELAGTTDTSDPAVVNMIRLLQTLDKDGNPDRIEITDTAKAVATPVDFSQSVVDFEASTAVKALISAAGQDAPVTDLISEADAIANFEASLDAAVSIDLTKITASSVITYSACLSTPGGWEYTFTNDTITLTGSDTWDTVAGCTLGAAETIPVPVADLTSDFDLPFNCAAYPVCVSADLNKTLTGIDGDGRAFTSTYNYDPAKKILTYVKSVEGDTFTEVISLHATSDVSPIIGAWLVSDEYTSVVVFLDKGRYIIAHTDNPDPDPDLGRTIPVSAEYGTYTWDAVSGELTTIVLGQSDGINGFSDIPSSNVTITGGDLILTAGGKTYYASKIDSANTMIGAWEIGDSDTDYHVLVFDGANYIVAHTNNTEPDADLGITVPVSAEYGTYTWDSLSESFMATMLGQSDGQGGLSDPGGTLKLEVDTSNMILTDSVSGAVIATRVR